MKFFKEDKNIVYDFPLKTWLSKLLTVFPPLSTLYKELQCMDVRHKCETKDDTFVLIYTLTYLQQVLINVSFDKIVIKSSEIYKILQEWILFYKTMMIISSSRTFYKWLLFGHSSNVSKRISQEFCNFNNTWLTNKGEF